MLCYNVRNGRPGPDGIYLVAELQADVKPDPMPLDGAGIEGMRSEERLDAGSRLLILADGGSEWILGEDRTWYERKKDTGGGGGEKTPEQVWEEAYEDPMDVYRETRPKAWPRMVRAEADNQICILVKSIAGAQQRAPRVGIRFGQNISGTFVLENGYSDEQGKFVMISGSEISVSESGPGSWIYMDLTCDHDKLPEVPGSVFDDRYAIFRIRSDVHAILGFLFLADYNAYTYNILETDIIATEGFVSFVATSGNNHKSLDDLKYAALTCAGVSAVTYASASIGGFPRSVVSILRLDGFANMEGPIFNGCSKLRGIPNLSDKKIISGKKPGHLFDGCSALKAAPRLPMTGENYDRMTGMFRGCTHLVAIHPDDIIDFSNAYDISETFCVCSNLTVIPKIVFTGKPSLDMFFRGCESLRKIEAIDVSRATSIAYMFDDCKSLTEAQDIYAHEATTISNLFRGCTSLVAAPNIYAPKATNASGIFSECSSIEHAGEIYIPKATMLQGAFSSCGSIEYVDLSGMNTEAAVDAQSIFSGCNRLRQVTIPDAVKFSNVRYMFRSCYSLTHIPDIDTALSSYATHFAYYCRSLISVPGNIDFSNATSIQYAFSNDDSLVEIGEIDLSSISSNGVRYAFQGMTSLESLGPLTGFGRNKPTEALFYLEGSPSTKKPLAHLWLDQTVEGWAGANITIAHCSLEHNAMVELFDSLPTITAAKNLTITGNPGADGLTAAEIAIATGKNWNVVGATNIHE